MNTERYCCDGECLQGRDCPHRPRHARHRGDNVRSNFWIAIIAIYGVAVVCLQAYWIAS